MVVDPSHNYQVLSQILWCIVSLKHWLLKLFYLTMVLMGGQKVMINPSPAGPGYALPMPTDLDLHCLSFSIWIYINDLDQVIWLADKTNRVWHHDLFSIGLMMSTPKQNCSQNLWDTRVLWSCCINIMWQQRSRSTCRYLQFDQGLSVLLHNHFVNKEGPDLMHKYLGWMGWAFSVLRCFNLTWPFYDIWLKWCF